MFLVPVPARVVPGSMAAVPFRDINFLQVQILDATDTTIRVRVIEAARPHHPDASTASGCEWTGPALVNVRLSPRSRSFQKRAGGREDPLKSRTGFNARTVHPHRVHRRRV